jgi:hypothetical protein
MLLALASSVFLGSECLGTRDHILLSQISDFPFRRILRLRVRVTLQLTVSQSVSQSVSQPWCRAPSRAHDLSYNSQGHGGGIRPRLHMGLTGSPQMSFLLPLCTDRVENVVSNSNYVVVEVCLRRRCIAVAVVSFVSRSLPINGFIRHSITTDILI